MVPTSSEPLLARSRAAARRITDTVRRWLSWAGVMLAVIVGGNVLADAGRINLPGASPALFWIGIVLAIASAILLTPPVFKRLATWGKAFGVILLLALFITAGNETQIAFDAYMRTDAGQQEQATVNARAERGRAAAAAADAKYRASPEYAAAQAAAASQRADDTKRKAEETAEKLEGCFSTFGHRLPTLEDQVKESLENPDAFEHVQTAVIDPDFYGHNVEMTIRAQNGFGAIRTANVKAKINPEDCSVQEVGSIED